MEGTEEEQPTSGKRKQREKSCTGNHVKKRRLGDKTQARRFFELRERRKKTVCFGCRKLGHSLKAYLFSLAFGIFPHLCTFRNVLRRSPSLGIALTVGKRVTSARIVLHRH